MEGRSDKTNRSALDKENKGIKGLVRTTCLKEEDQGGGKRGSGEEFHFG